MYVNRTQHVYRCVTMGRSHTHLHDCLSSLVSLWGFEYMLCIKNFLPGPTLSDLVEVGRDLLTRVVLTCMVVGLSLIHISNSNGSKSFFAYSPDL